MPRDGRDPRLPSTRALTRSLALTALVIAAACRPQSAECQPGPNESPIPSEPVIRTIALNQRWPGHKASLCWREIRVIDGGFRVIGHFEGEPSWSDPWYTAFFLGGRPSALVDDRGQTYATTGLSATGPAVILVQGLRSPTTATPAGDLLAGVRRLTLEIPNHRDAIQGPWVFSVPARSGPLQQEATANGRQLELHDLVVTSDSFYVGFMEVADYSPAVVGNRSMHSEFGPARDSRDRTYAVAGSVRVASSMYMKFTPAPPPDVTLTITLERIFVTTDRTWSGTLTLP